MPDKFSHRIKLALNALVKGEAPVQRRQDIPAITPEEVAEIKEFFPLDKFFIFGHARSGTTLLTRLVRLHPQVHCNYQGHFFTRAPLLEGLVADPEVGTWLIRRSNRWNHGRDLSPLVMRAAADFIMERDARQNGKSGAGCVVGDKSPNSLLDGEAVHRLVKVYPEACLVFIVRDGRDAVISHRFQAFIDNPQSLSKEDLQIREDFSRNPEPFHAAQRSIFTEKGLRQSARGWAHNVIETDKAARELLGEAYYPLRYEDLLQQPYHEMSKLWAFLGADPTLPGLKESLAQEMGENPDADWQQEKAGEIAGTLTKGKRGTWQDLFTPRDRQIFKETAGETLIAWGYEKGPDW
jgi:hypothetical protein